MNSSAGAGELPHCRAGRDETALRFITVLFNQGRCSSRGKTYLRTTFQRVAILDGRGDHARSDHAIELAGPPAPAGDRRNKLRHNPPMCSNYDMLTGFDSPNVPAKVVLQFAYAGLR